MKNLLMFCLIKRIQGKLHRIGTYDVCKVSLSCFDDKRHILGDDINSLAYFHKDIESQQLIFLDLIINQKVNHYRFMYFRLTKITA